MDLLEDSVRDALAKVLHRAPETIADIVAENLAELKRRHEGALVAWHLENADPAGEIAKLETEIGRLVGAIAAGLASADVVASINAKRAKVDELKARTVPQLPEWLTFDRLRFLETMSQVEGIRPGHGRWAPPPGPSGAPAPRRG